MKKIIILTILILVNPFVTYYLVDVVVSANFRYGLALSNYVYESPIFIIIYVLQVISNFVAMAFIYSYLNKINYK